MEKAAEGDRSASDEIVRRHQDKLQRFATRMTGNSNFAQDATVCAFFSLWKKRKAYRPNGKLEAWLLRTVYRQCLDHLRDDGCEAYGVEAEASSPEFTPIAEALKEAVMKLPSPLRSVAILSICEENSYEEIARILEISPGTVASRKHEAVIALRRRLAAWNES
jgi:RNA polymerase sigma-70 factor (ECF subfamily)